MAADFSWSSSPLCIPLFFSHWRREERDLPSLGDFLKAFSALWTLDSRSLATSRREEPPVFMKARWARHALRSWAVSTSLLLLRSTDENVWHTSSSFLQDDLRFFRFRFLPRGGSGRRSLGMLAINFLVLDVNLPHSRVAFFPMVDASCCIFLPTLPRPSFTLLMATTWMGLTPGCLGLFFFVVRAAVLVVMVADEPPRRNGSGMRRRGNAGTDGTAPSPFVMHSPSKKRDIKKPILMFRMVMVFVSKLLDYVVHQFESDEIRG
mmetsp:Transcript_7025/g.13083  ORF Transcript_7025/g.13083 Transcript_7025/m.13083 type:complete len:264 (+) Transcript_7025:530-1321(+)